VIIGNSDHDLLVPLVAVQVDLLRSGTRTLIAPVIPGIYMVVLARYPPRDEAPPIPCTDWGSHIVHNVPPFTEIEPRCASLDGIASVGPLVVRPLAVPQSQAQLLQTLEKAKQQAREGRLEAARVWVEQQRLCLAASKRGSVEFSLRTWLRSLELEEYHANFERHGFKDHDVDLVLTLTSQDLTELGIEKLAHRKKLLLHAPKLLHVPMAVQVEEPGAIERRTATTRPGGVA